MSVELRLIGDVMLGSFILALLIYGIASLFTGMVGARDNRKNKRWEKTSQDPYYAGEPHYGHPEMVDYGSPSNGQQEPQDGWGKNTNYANRYKLPPAPGGKQPHVDIDDAARKLAERYLRSDMNMGVFGQDYKSRVEYDYQRSKWDFSKAEREVMRQVVDQAKVLLERAEQRARDPNFWKKDR